MLWWIKMGLVSVLFMRAIYTDIKRQKIENQLIGIGLVAALVCSCISGGQEGLIESMKMVFIVVIALFFLFVIKGLGAGDIKLLGVMSAFFPEEIITIIVFAFFSGAVYALGRMVIRAFLKQPVYQHREMLNFSIPIAMGTIVTEVIKQIK